VVPKVKPKAFCPSPDVAVFELWKSDPPKPAKAPPKERLVDAVVVVAVVPPKLFRVNPVDAAGVDVRADERVRPLAEVEVIGRANGVADAAGLVNPKLKPVVDVDVVAGVPVFVPPRVNPVVGFDPKSPVPKPLEGADVVAGVAVLPRVPKLSPTEGLRSLAGRTRAGKARKRGYLDAPVPKEKPPPAPVPPAATVVEPSVLVPKENPVDMAAGAQRRQEAARGLGRSSLLKAKAGRAASLSPSRDLAGTSSPSGREDKAEVGGATTRENVPAPAART